MMKKLILAMFILFHGLTLADQLPREHFMFPRDWEPLWLLGIERGLSFSGAVRNLKNCQRPQELTTPFRQFHCQVYEGSVQAPSVNLKYSNENFPSLTFFGETHTLKEGHQFLNQLIKDSPANFFNTLALEMFNYTAQAEVDRLIEANASRQQWRELLSQHWSYDLDGYLDIIQTSLQKGMHILALDDRRKERGVRHDATFSEDMIYRDQHMAKSLIQYFTANPKHRVLFLTGKLHALKTLGAEKITIREKLSDELSFSLPGFRSKHYLLFGLRSTVLFRSLDPNNSRERSYFLEKPIDDYADQVFLF